MDVTLIEDNNEGTCSAPQGTVFVENQDVERDLAPQEPVRTDRKLERISGALPIMAILEGD